MFQKIIFIALVIFNISACSSDSYIKPLVNYQADFNSVDTDQAEISVKAVGQRWDLFQIYEKDRSQMRLLTDGQDAFYIAFYFKDKVVLDISNVAVGKVITLSLFDHGDIPIETLKFFSNEIIEILNKDLDIHFKKVPSSK